MVVTHSNMLEALDRLDYAADSVAHPTCSNALVEDLFEQESATPER